MIYLNNKELEQCSIGKRIVVEIYKGAILVWEAIKSCFGAGFWKSEAPWVDTEGWKYIKESNN